MSRIELVFEDCLVLTASYIADIVCKCDVDYSKLTYALRTVERTDSGYGSLYKVSCAIMAISSYPYQVMIGRSKCIHGGVVLEELHRHIFY